MIELPPNPFPGLRPFQKNESQLFFGRENHIKEILRKLETYRFVSIVGNSGSGKSSLVRAGVLSQIENNENNIWKVCLMRPGKNPIEELCEALSANELFGSNDHGERKIQRSDAIAILTKSRLGIVQIVRHLLPEGKRLLILVDQFEELFRFNSIYLEHGSNIDISSHFVELLLGAIGQKDVPIYVMMTVRSDFLGDCEQFMGLPEAINDGQFLIPRMNRVELESCITGPLHLVNRKISPQLVHQLLGEVGNSEDQLPVLQHVLMRTWEVWKRENNPAKPIGIEEYIKTGGMEKALSNHAEEAYQELNTNKKKKLAEVIFKTITVKGPDGRGIRRPTSIDKIVLITESSFEEIKEIVNIFRRPDRGFMMPPATVELTEENILDISHESLMRVWHRLKTWVEEEAESAEIYHRICDSASHYDKNMAGLWRDPDLQIAVDWQLKSKPNVHWAEQYNPNFDLAIRFIDASIQDKKYEFAEKRRRKKITQLVVVTFLISLSALTVWAFFERSRSEKSEMAALSEKQKAEQKTAEAWNQKELAEKAKEQSIEASRKALDAKDFAELQKTIADSQSQIATRQSAIAQQERILAQQQAKKAKEQSLLAKQKEQLAEQEKEMAVVAQSEADRLRLVSLGEAVAFKSLQVKSDPQLAALLSNEAYSLTKDNNGNIQDPQIYNALFQSLKNLSSVTYPPVTNVLSEVAAINVSADGRLFTILANGTLRQYSGTDNRPASSVALRGEPLNTAYLGYDCKYAVTSYDDNSIRIWNTATGSGSPPLPGHSGLVRAAAFSGDGSQVITGGRDSSVIIWNNNKLQQQIKFPSRIRALAITGNNNRVLAGCEDGVVYEYNITSKKISILLNDAPARIECITYSSLNKYLVVSSSSGQVSVMNAEGQTIKTLSEGHTVNFVSADDQSGLLAEAAGTRLVRIYNLNDLSQKPLEITDLGTAIKGLALSKQGLLTVACGNNTIRSYSVRSSVIQSLLTGKITRSLTQDEWNIYIGKDVPYKK